MRIPAYAKEFPWSLIKYYSKMNGVSKELIASVIQVESSGNAWAFRYEPNYKWTHDTNILQHRWKCSGPTALLVQQCSYGLMQLMGATYLDLGGKDIPTNLFNPEENIEYGSLFLKKLLNKYNFDPIDCYAAYNAGHVKVFPNGKYENEWAVIKFREVYSQFMGNSKVETIEIGG